MRSHRRPRATVPLCILPLLATGCSGSHSPAATGEAVADSTALPEETPAPAGISVSTSATPVPGALVCQVPDSPGPFVVHGTTAVPGTSFARFPCPYRLADPDGNELDTQWELVARLQDKMIVELRAAVPQNPWSGSQVFPIVQAPSPLHLRDFDVEAFTVAVTPFAIALEIEDQAGGTTRRTLTGFDPAFPIYRLGPATITLENASDGPLGGLQSWVTVDARQKEVELVFNWNNGTLPADPDVYFRSAKLVVPSGWTWTSFLPDPAGGNGYLVQPDDHVLPQRMERSFRVVVHPVGTTPDLSYRGWAVSDWTSGGYLAQDIPLPDLSHVQSDLTPEKESDYDLLARNQPTVPGDDPVSPLWPAQGVKYGGMTGGIDILQFEGVVPAATAQVDGLLSLFVEQLRYGSRQMGCIYERSGRPIVIEDYTNSDGSLPWSMFNNEFQGNPAKDKPFYFSQTGPGTGTAAYDPLEYAPIDDQHLIRRTKANKVLTWLDNDPLARLYVMMDATLQRMTYYEGPYGRIAPPAAAQGGVAWGRGEAWAADVLATAYALGDDAWRARNGNWFTEFAGALAYAQMPNGLFSVLSTGKVVTSPPYGHRLSEVCPYGIHALDPTRSTEVPDFYGHRGNEQVFLCDALSAIERTSGVGTGPLIAKAVEGLWNLAWKAGSDGILDRYPVAQVNGPLFLTRSQIPSGLTVTIPKDNYHVGTGLYGGLVNGAAALPALYAYTGSSDLTQARQTLENRGTDYIENWAPLLALLQEVAP